MLTLAQLAARIAEDHWYAPTFGSNAAAIAAKRTLFRSVLETFERSFPRSPERQVAACFIPGRVEILGKHTDYAGGHSLLAAVDRGFFCVSSLNETGSVRMVQHGARFDPCAFPVAPDLEQTQGHWSNYPMTMCRRLAANFPGSGEGSGSDRALGGVDIAFGCDLPVAGGLSGSSALMIMTFFALAVPNGLMQSERFTAQIGSRLDLAMYLACAENGQTFRALAGSQGVGTFGGSEDHTQILNAQPGVLSLYQFCPTLLERECPFPSDLSLVVAYSGVEAAKTGSAMEQYNRAARRAQAAVQFHNQAFGTSFQLLRDLADAFGADGARRLEEPGAELAASRRVAELDLPGRYQQFFEEDRRLIPAAAQALERRDYTRLGELVDESHALSRVHLHNIVPEIDALQATARQLGALAASGFGAGFGGSAYAIVPNGTETLFTQTWREAYHRRFPERAAASYFFPTAVSGRAAELFV